MTGLHASLPPATAGNINPTVHEPQALLAVVLDGGLGRIEARLEVHVGVGGAVLVVERVVTAFTSVARNVEAL